MNFLHEEPSTELNFIRNHLKLKFQAEWEKIVATVQGQCVEIREEIQVH